MLNHDETQNCGITPTFDIQPRVYLRKMGGEYTEIVGIRSFERNDGQGSGGTITFVMSDNQDGDLTKILLSASDQYVDVKMEFLIEMLMVMTFSGFVDNVSDNTVCIAVSTAITTDVLNVVH